MTSTVTTAIVTWTNVSLISGLAVTAPTRPGGERPGTSRSIAPPA